MPEVTGRILTKAWMARLENGAIKGLFEFQFNPTQRNSGRAPQWDFISPVGSTEPFAIFKSIAGRTISFTLLLDATVGYSDLKQGVRAQKAWLEQFVNPDVTRFINDLGQFVGPPDLMYGMAGMHYHVKMTKCTPRDVRWNTKGFETRTYMDIELQTVFTDAAAIKSRLIQQQNLFRRVETLIG